MNYLTGDIGNTSTKLSILDYKFVIKKTYIVKTKNLYKKKNVNKFFKVFLNKNLNKKVLFSSVVPNIYKMVKGYLKDKHFQALEIKDLNIKKILKVNIKNFEQLGSDRIANAIGANKNQNCLIVDFGTATTFDIVINKVYEGGVIAPGIKLSILNLSKFTATLPIFKLKSNSKVFGKNTKDALNAGFLWGYQGLIINIIKKINLKFKVNFKIILTGGYASVFDKFIYNNSTIDKHITVKGIMFIYKNLIK